MAMGTRPTVGRRRRRWSGGSVAALFAVASVLVTPASGVAWAEEPAVPQPGSSTPASQASPTQQEPAEARPATPAAIVPAPGPVMVHERRKDLVILGGIGFGVSWGLALLASLTVSSTCSQACKNASHIVWIPVAGPMLAERRDPSAEPAFTTAWTLVEGAGLVLLAVGLVGHDVPAHEAHPGGPTISLAPTISRSAGGLQLSATF